MAATAAVGIFTAARSRLAARNFRKERQKAVQAAIAAALKEALLKILPELSDQPDHMRQYLDLFGRWLAHPPVLEELGKLVAPVPDAMPDVARLRAAFVELDFDPDQLTPPFATIVDILFDAFCDSDAWEGDLQAAIALREDRKTNRRLAALDHRYLAAVYKESNQLPLADAQPDQIQPRLPRVFVDVRIHGEAPDVAQIVSRLGLVGDGEARFRRAVKRVLTEGEPGLRSATARQPAADEHDIAWHELVARLDPRQLDALAKALAVEQEELRSALGDTLPLPDCTLTILTPEGINRFMGRWHAELVTAKLWNAELAERRRSELARALEERQRSELRKMAGTPLRLTMMEKLPRTP